MNRKVPMRSNRARSAVLNFLLFLAAPHPLLREKKNTTLRRRRKIVRYHQAPYRSKRLSSRGKSGYDGGGRRGEGDEKRVTK